MTSAPIAREVAFRVADFFEKETGTKAVLYRFPSRWR